MKTVPLRTCIACRREMPKSELLRVVKSAAGEISLDFSGKLPGRGAYLCDKKECVLKLRKYRLLNRAFSAEVSEEIYRRIEEEYASK